MESLRILPDKKYFKIGEVADLVGVEPHVLRYWETQFPQVRPHKARSGHRLYRRRELEVLLAIRELLHVQRFTIAGARQALRQPGGLSSLLPRITDQPGLDAESGISASAPASYDEPDAGDVDGESGFAADADASVEGSETLNDLRTSDESETRVVAGTTETPRTVMLHGLGFAGGLDPSSDMDLRCRVLLEGALSDAHRVLEVLKRHDSASQHASEPLSQMNTP